jgi:hypothetical protein
MAVHIEVIEFVGGPFDGFVQFVDYPSTELERFLRFPINANVLAQLNGSHSGRMKPATSVAVYELMVDENALRYAHLGSVEPRQFALTHWVG